MPPASPIFCHLESSWCHLGTVLERPGGSLGESGEFPERSKIVKNRWKTIVFRLMEVILPMLRHLAASFAYLLPSWVILGSFGDCFGRLWATPEGRKLQKCKHDKCYSLLVQLAFGLLSVSFQLACGSCLACFQLAFNLLSACFSTCSLFAFSSSSARF